MGKRGREGKGEKKKKGRGGDVWPLGISWVCHCLCLGGELLKTQVRAGDFNAVWLHESLQYH
jgi:hypothetical protein